MLPSRVHLAHLPTPIWRHDALDELVGTEVWVKRDDMTGGAEAGNKIRKLEFLLADALAQGADMVMTCGAAQSNHARATALVARQYKLDCWLFLRVRDSADEARLGNLMLSKLTGAAVHFISPAQYAERQELMQQAAAQQARAGRQAYVIPEGGSNGLGALGYVEAMREVHEQAQLGLAPKQFDCVVCACGSGGTAAGIALGLGLTGLAPKALAFAVCDDSAYFDRVCAEIFKQARALRPELPEPAPLELNDRHQGPAYGIMSDEQKDFLQDVAARCGLILDPVYSGKALYGLSRLDQKPKRALFIHTGGLPGLLAQAQAFEPPV